MWTHRDQALSVRPAPYSSCVINSFYLLITPWRSQLLHWSRLTASILPRCFVDLSSLLCRPACLFFFSDLVIEVMFLFLSPFPFGVSKSKLQTVNYCNWFCMRLINFVSRLFHVSSVEGCPLSASTLQWLNASRIGWSLIHGSLNLIGWGFAHFGNLPLSVTLSILGFHMPNCRQLIARLYVVWG